MNHDTSSIPADAPIDISSTSMAGKLRRLSHIFPAGSDRTIIVPVDDSLIFGPTSGLEEIDRKVRRILIDPPNAVLAFHGFFKTHARMLSTVGGIVNLTASTVLSAHTRKVQIGTVDQAVQIGVDAAAAHVNVSSQFESEMLTEHLDRFRETAKCTGMPLLAIMYPRSEAEGKDDNFDELRQTDRKAYANLVARACRIGVDLGADIVKTKFTGDAESFSRVVDACRPVPIVIAGGPILNGRDMLRMVAEAVQGGARGISFGRNVFGRDDPTPFLSAIKSIVHRQAKTQSNDWKTAQNQHHLGHLRNDRDTTTFKLPVRHPA